MKQTEEKIINILNKWYDNLTPLEEEDFIKYEFTKTKFRTKYLMRTGEFLKITKRLEAITFNNICTGLSKNYTVTEDLLDQYLEWCFDNYDFFSKKYKGFSLASCAAFASEWDINFLNFKFADKLSLKDLDGLEVGKNIFYCFEKYGIALAATKLMQEKNADRKSLENVVIKKLESLTTNKEDLNKLKNMLRTTVENAPYSSEVLFWNYGNSFLELFLYFKNEPWCPKC